MVSDSARQTQLRQALGGLAAAGVVPGALPALDASLEQAGETVLATVLDEIGAFTASGDPGTVPELRAHCLDHVAEIRRLLGGGPVGRFGFVREQARRRAAQKFPLEATLHAYRCGHKVLSRWLRDATEASLSSNLDRAVAAIADFSIEYTDTISNILTAEYVARTRLLAEAESDRKSELLDLLLRGYDEADPRVTRLLRHAGYLEQRLSFCVVAAQPVEPREMENPARAQRLTVAVSDALKDLKVRLLTGVRDNQVIAIAADTRRQSGWTAPQSRLADRLLAPLARVGPAAVIGVSSDAPSTSHVRKALEEARLALEFASVADRVVTFAGIPVRDLLLRVAGDNVRSALPAWIDRFLETDRRSRGKLLATLQAYADADMNVLRAARQLSVHPNTVYARMQRIAEVTGHDPLGYHNLTELLLAASCRSSAVQRWTR